jgi:hypothetical protein
LAILREEGESSLTTLFLRISKPKVANSQNLHLYIAQAAQNNFALPSASEIRKHGPVRNDCSAQVESAKANFA